MAHPLQALRDVMAEHQIDAYLIPTADFHGSEYVGEHFACREYSPASPAPPAPCWSLPTGGPVDRRAVLSPGSGGAQGL